MHKLRINKMTFDKSNPDFYNAGPCPTCGEFAVSTYRHPFAPVICPNNHEWHRKGHKEKENKAPRVRDDFYTSKYPINSVTADMVIVNEKKELLFIKRNTKPFKGRWAFAGGFLDPEDQDLKDCAIREVQEELGITLERNKVVDCTTLSSVDRDPRGRTISQVFMVLVSSDVEINQADDEVSDTQWIALDDISSSSLAFDHFSVVEMLQKLDENLDIRDLLGNV